jgi:hypothetical protein
VKIYLVYFVAAVFLQVAPNVTQKRNVADTSDYQQDQTTSKNDDSEECGDGEGGSYDRGVALKILGDCVPMVLLFFDQVECVEGKSIDGLTGSVCQNYPFPTLVQKSDLLY